MKIILLFIIISLPLISISQEEYLTGIWKIKERKVLNGRNYANGLPKLIKIDQKDEVINFQFTTVNAKEEDTVIYEILKLGNTINEKITTSGKRKEIVFDKGDNKNSWTKQSVIYSIDNNKLAEISIAENWIISSGSDQLIISKTQSDIVKKDSFSMMGVFEKITPEGLAYETATGKGVKFEEGLTWEQILAKAKKENKFIFVDCYATWCAPCKKMDKEVFPLNRVGGVMNDRFISLKVQMDSSKNDNDAIKNLYTTARYFEREFKIIDLPTYLFFSPTGKAIHKSTGGHTSSSFISMINATLNPDNQLYTLIDKWENRKFDYKELPILIKRIRNDFKEKDIAILWAKDYMINYLDKLSEHDFLTKENLEFLADNSKIINTKVRAFSYYYNHGNKVDSVMGETGYAQRKVRGIIYTDEVRPFLLANPQTNNNMINWGKIKNKISKKYGLRIALLTIADAKIIWYAKQKMWNNYALAIVERIDLEGYKNAPTSGLGAGAYLNDFIWEVFLYTSDKKALNKSLIWIDYAIKIYNKDTLSIVSPMDTKANILYKLGRIEEAIKLEEDVVKLRPNMSKILDKMKRRIPTWHIQ